MVPFFPLSAGLMQKKRAIVLQQEWGGKPCDHPAFAKEYDLGERTGNHVCTQCGKIFTFREKAEIVAGRTAVPLFDGPERNGSTAD